MTQLTIITPVFNGADFIEETVKSVLKNASGSDFEYIVVDDGSTDSTPTILESFKNEIRYVRQENKGQAFDIHAICMLCFDQCKDHIKLFVESLLI